MVPVPAPVPAPVLGPVPAPVPVGTGGNWLDGTRSYPRVLSKGKKGLSAADGKVTKHTSPHARRRMHACVYAHTAAAACVCSSTACLGSVPGFVCARAHAAVAACFCSLAACLASALGVAGSSGAYPVCTPRLRTSRHVRAPMCSRRRSLLFSRCMPCLRARHRMLMLACVCMPTRLSPLALFLKKKLCYNRANSASAVPATPDYSLWSLRSWPHAALSRGFARREIGRVGGWGGGRMERHPFQL